MSPVKGVEGFNRSSPVSGPTFVDATEGGKRLRRGARLWTVAVSTFKALTLSLSRAHRRSPDPMATGIDPTAMRRDAVAHARAVVDLCRLARKAADARSIKAAHAFEINNHGCAVGCDRPGGAFYADLLLSEGRDVTLIANDDAHFSEYDHFDGWVMVKADANAPDLLLEALKRGNFYSSEGPELRGIELTA